MEFLIADTFTDSLARLNTEEQKAAKITALDLQLNPAHPSLQFHKLEKARDKQFWSVRVNSDVRLIVHRTADEDTILTIATHLPAEAAEAVLEIAVGGKPQPPVRLPAGANAFDHPDAQRRFRVMASAEDLARTLDFPWEKWTVFLHPAQRQLVERSYHGPARVMGSAGPARRLWRFIGLCSWRARTKTRESCWPRFPMRWQMRCGQSCGI